MPNDNPDEFASGFGPAGVFESQLDYIDFVARYHGDEAYRESVDADPAAALRSAGARVPEDVEVRLLFSGEDVLHVVLPAPATGLDPGGGSGGG